MLTPKTLKLVSEILGEELNYSSYLQAYLAGESFTLGIKSPGKFFRASPKGNLTCILPKEGTGRPFDLRLQKREICRALGALATAKVPLALSTRDLLENLLRAQDFKEAFLEGVENPSCQ